MTLRKTLLSLALGTLSLASAAQTYFEQLAADGVEIMALVKYGLLDYDYRTRMAQGLYELSYENLYQPVKDSPLMLCQPAGGAVYHDGKLYVNEYDDTGQVHKQKPMWRVYDGETWEMLSEVEQPDNCEATTTSLAYDPTTDMIYGFLSTYTETFFVSVDPATGKVTRIGSELPYTNKYTCIACNRKGQLYCIYFDKDSSTHYLARIRKSDGKVANIGTMVIKDLLPDDSFVDGGYAQSLFFNNATGNLYWLFQSSTAYLSREEYTALMQVNTTTAEASLKSYLTDALLIPAAFFKEPIFTAPGGITEFAFQPTTDDRLNATLGFKLPSTDYVGKAIEGDLQVYVVEEGDTLAQGTGKPGSTFTTPELAFTTGQHEVWVTVRNAENLSSPIVKQQFYAGFDRPAACQNIKLTADGLTTTLTWEAPVSGVSGAPINPETYTYTVIRYPYEVTVAEGLKAFSFTEEHPEDMTRYVYIVKAVDALGREGTSAFSNNLIVGTPLTVPYGGEFTGPADMLNYYTIIDSNNDQYSWSYDVGTNSAIYTYNADMDADDWLISPPIIYEAGETYEVSFDAFSTSEDYPEALEVRCGDARTTSSQTTLLLDVPEVPYAASTDEATSYTVSFTAPADGLYYYSFRCTSPAYHYSLYLRKIRVYKEGMDGIGTVLVGDEDTSAQPAAVFTLAGTRISPAAAQAPGVYIYKYANGTSRKVVRK